MSENKEQNPRFTGVFIPVEILMMNELSSTDIILLSWIDALDDTKNKHGGCYASNQYLASIMHITEKRVQIIISKLKDLKLIKQISFNGRIRVLHSNMFKKISIDGAKKNGQTV